MTLPPATIRNHLTLPVRLRSGLYAKLDAYRLQDAGLQGPAARPTGGERRRACTDRHPRDSANRGYLVAKVVRRSHAVDLAVVAGERS